MGAEAAAAATPAAPEHTPVRAFSFDPKVTVASCYPPIHPGRLSCSNQSVGGCQDPAKGAGSAAEHAGHAAGSEGESPDEEAKYAADAEVNVRAHRVLDEYVHELVKDLDPDGALFRL